MQYIYAALCTQEDSSIARMMLACCKTTSISFGGKIMDIIPVLHR
jgi:hypothetical protein